MQPYKQNVCAFFRSLLRTPIWPLPFEWNSILSPSPAHFFRFHSMRFFQKLHSKFVALILRIKFFDVNLTFTFVAVYSGMFKGAKQKMKQKQKMMQKKKQKMLQKKDPLYWSDNSKSTGKWDCFLFLNASNENGIVRLKLWIPIWHLSGHKCVCDKLFFLFSTGCRHSDVSIFLYGDLWGQWKIAVDLVVHCENLTYCKMKMVTIIFFSLLYKINFKNGYRLIKACREFNANSHNSHNFSHGDITGSVYY